MSVGVHASNDNFMYTSGIVNNCANVGAWTIDHVVLLIGYTSTHWIIKNSYSSGWGDNGYAYISKTSDCGISNLVDYLNVNGPRFDENTPTPTPTPDPDPVTDGELKIVMHESYGDQWQERFQFVQNGVSILTFGSEIQAG